MTVDKCANMQIVCQASEMIKQTKSKYLHLNNYFVLTYSVCFTTVKKIVFSSYTFSHFYSIHFGTT